MGTPAVENNATVMIMIRYIFLTAKCKNKNKNFKSFCNVMQLLTSHLFKPGNCLI